MVAKPNVGGSQALRRLGEELAYKIRAAAMARPSAPPPIPAGAIPAPTSFRAAGLNPAETDALQRLLRQVADTGVTLLVVEHDMHFVRSLCEHVVVLNFGEKIFEGTPEEVHRDPNVLEAYLGSHKTAAGGA